MFIDNSVELGVQAAFRSSDTAGNIPFLSRLQDLIRETHVVAEVGRPKRMTLIITHNKDLLKRLQPQVVCCTKDASFLMDHSTNSSHRLLMLFGLISTSCRHCKTGFAQLNDAGAKCFRVQPNVKFWPKEAFTYDRLGAASLKTRHHHPHLSGSARA